MNIDPKLFTQAYEIGNKIVDLLKNHKADAALLGALAAVAILRRKTSIQLDDMLNRLRTIDNVVDLVRQIVPTKDADGG